MRAIVPIAFNVNKDYLQHLCVVLTSILNNNKDIYFEFNVLNSDIKDEDKKIISKLSDRYSNFSLQFIKVDGKRFSSLKIHSPYIKIETYYRFILADVLTEYDKVLYLDADLIVNGSIEPLFNTDIKDYYFAGVEERCLYGTDYIEKTLKLSHDDLYVNAGVLLCNLKKIREDNLVEKLFFAAETLKEFIKYDDQDVINIVCRKKIKQLDCKYNFTPFHLYELWSKKYDAVIIHYTGMYKPWSLGECPNELRFLYFRYLELSPYFENLKVSNFCIYHKSSYLWETDAIKPIQTGTAFSKRGMDILQASRDDSIDFKNNNYGELTAWYWVWKNYIPKHKTIEYIGFCHYRRFLDFGSAPNVSEPLCALPLNVFISKYNNNYCALKIYADIRDYDVVLPTKVILKDKTIEEQYLDYHPKRDLDIVKGIIAEFYPEYEPYLKNVLNSDSAYFNLLFTMRTYLVEDFFKWIFDILSKLEVKSNWEEYKEYNNIRTPAYLAERLFNVWLEYNIEVNNIKVLERRGIFIVYPDTTVDANMIKKVKDKLWVYQLKKVFYKIGKMVSFGKRKSRYDEKYRKTKSLLSTVRGR